MNAQGLFDLNTLIMYLSSTRLGDDNEINRDQRVDRAEEIVRSS